MIQIFSSMVSVVGYGILISQMWLVWTQPTSADNEVILSFAVLMAFEFFLVHSGIFMSTFRDKKAWIFFIIFYGLFAVVFNASMPNNLVLYVYAIIVLNRMSVIFFKPSRKDIAQARVSSMVAAGIYVLAVGIAVVARDVVPDFGLHQEFLQNSGYLESLKIKGEFPENPKTAIAAGCLYYACLSIWEILQNFKKKPKPAFNA